ncbi:RHS repeat-associated core domain-containing protein [Blastopirellula marina]|uniref:Teneurin-like YD-shell domain-containing protein n=1 Tax=Blastopirellula marina TaxID=124 RepID=A0A2S8GGC6_9BACT|nr:RHS repeat-associated core domain-containing protein [Blastopirellula marina]PQO43499.1 hypothetical protein C5Y93_22865 [Blastopirellula marina]
MPFTPVPLDFSAAWTVYEYDALGRTLSETNRLGNETSYDYDNLGRLIKKTDAEGGETEYTYDANGNRLTLTDPEENTTTWTYDYLNRMLTNTNELSDTRYYEYDAAGNLVEYADRNGRVTVYEYDDLQRRTAEKWMDGMTTVHTISYSYDAASQLIEASDSAATYTFTYDNLGRNTSTEHDLAALGFDVVIDEAYDALGRRTSLTAEIDGTEDLENTYAYDYLNRMTQVTQAGQSGGNAVAEKRVDFTYDAEDKYQFTSITRYADLAGTETVAVSTYGYDYADQLTSLTHVDGGSSTLAGYTYSYDEGNRLTAFTVYGYSAEDATYSYDDTDQLTGADRSGTTSDESYTYDENGNRTGGGYSTGDNNQVLSDGTYNYTYDDEGNRLTKTNISTGDYEVYAWDYRNRLASVTAYDASDVKQWKVGYGYDAFNNLVSREVDSNGDGMVDASGYFVYNGNQIMLVVDDAGDVEHRMLWGPQVDQLLADENGAGDVLWALNDNQNTVRDYVKYDELLDDSTVVNHIAYDAVGQIDSETSGALDTFRFRYTGKYVDLLTGLQYNLNRWYDPATALWMSQDPIGFNAGDANLYRYVENGYVNRVDPSGLQSPHAVFGPAFGGGGYSGPLIRFKQEIIPLDRVDERIGDAYYWAYTGSVNTENVAHVEKSGQNDVWESGDKLCAKLLDIKDLYLDVLQVIPSTKQDTTRRVFFTDKGYLEMLGHEARRLKVYQDAAEYYLKPVSGTDSELFRNAVEIARDAEGVASGELSQYVVSNQEQAIARANAYIDYAQGEIEKENDNIVYGPVLPPLRLDYGWVVLNGFSRTFVPLSPEEWERMLWFDPFQLSDAPR